MASKVNIFKHKITIPVYVLLSLIIVWFLLGIEATAYILRGSYEKRLHAAAKEEIDAEKTLQFLKTTFMTDPSTFIHPEDKKIIDIAKNLSSAEDVYDWMKSNIKYEQNKTGSPTDLATLSTRGSNCFGVAALTTSLLRASGVAPDDVHITTGQLLGNAGPPHAWTELKVDGEWVVVDPTNFVMEPVGRLIMDKEAYLAPFPKKNLLFEYNDKSFRFELNQ